MTHVYKHISCLEVLKFHNNDSKLEVYLYIHICICMYFCVYTNMFFFFQTAKKTNTCRLRGSCVTFMILCDKSLHQVCCSVLQSVAVCCGVLQYVAVCCSVVQNAINVWGLFWEYIGLFWIWCSVLQCVAVCCSMLLQCVAVCGSAL